MKRHHWILLSVLVVQVALSAVFDWPREAGGHAAEPVFPDLTAEGIVEVAIADNADNEVTLVREDNGWVLAGTGGYPVLADRLDPVLEKLAALHRDQLVTGTEGSHDQLEVADDSFQRRVRLTTSDGAVHTIYLGSSPSYGASHFRLASETDVFLTTDLTAWELGADAASWIDVSYVSVSPSEVQRMVVENESGTLEFLRGEEGAWVLTGVPEGRTVDTAQVDQFVNRLMSFSMARPLGVEPSPEYGLDEPNATVTIELVERDVRITFGSPLEGEDAYAVKADDQAYYVAVPSYLVKPIVEQTADALLMEPAATSETE